MTDINKFNLSDGTYIRFTKIGKGEPLVLLHTIRNRLEYFNLVIPYLKDTYTVYAIDLPGFGDSPVNKNTNYDQSFMTDAVIDFIEQNNLSGVTIAGESIGGVLPITVANKIPDIIITDPPRDGMHKKVIEQILKITPSRIIYISCNSATQARDIALMNKKYKITKIQPIDMFPQTHHVENIVVLEHR